MYYLAKIIGITGGKGGTGKSTVATALAVELAKSASVLLVDADVDCPNDHLILSIERRFKSDIDQRVPIFDTNICTRCGECGAVCKTNALISIKGKNLIFIQPQCNGCGSCHFVCKSDAISWGEKKIGQVFEGVGNNIYLLSGELKGNEPVSEFIVNSLMEFVEEEKGDYDYIIIDTAAGTHCPVIAAIEKCDYVFSVTEPTPLGKHDLDIILQLLKKLNKRSDIILNRSDMGDGKIISDLALEYGLSIVCKIPYSNEVVNSYSAGKPVSFEGIIDLIKVIER